MDDKLLGKWYVGECRAPGLPGALEQSEEESEIISASDGTELPDEEQETEPDLQLAYDELESIKQQLKLLRSKVISTPADPCEQEVPLPLENTDFLTPQQQKLLQLRRSNCVLRCQLQKQAQHLYATRNEIKTLQTMRCRLHEQLQQMAKQLQQFDQFKLKAVHQFGLCIERNEQIKASKMDAKDFMDTMEASTKHNEGSTNAIVPLHCHEKLRSTLFVELIRMRIFLHTLFANMLDDWELYKRRMKLRCVCCDV
ncbi:uncharacterized protein LOC108597060 isoform X2 [Drosophila busckii]|uniref:uncharacterized protein LOC108597060 isoform X2 n=1 Tax=Drosophila busckii TaxID=30019 RepID=UPI00083F2F7E|nr:uncharacterized protein LOC108597060 isoform X2 [Drosophila busckii]